ncbi:MAG: host attachment protein [Gammaproteobacteria bacterium]|nr:host attachment protein [Gammaproteobacteria bacterium]
MNHNCVVVAGGSRARFFTLRDAEFPEMESGPNLCEVADLVNPENELPGSDLWTNLKSGRNRGGGGSPAHGYDDHRSQHEDEIDRRFARNIAREASRLIQANATRELVLVAQKRVLGFLRNELNGLAKAGVEIRELAKDLSKLSPLELHEHLARERLIPERRSPAG